MTRRLTDSLTGVKCRATSVAKKHPWCHTTNTKEEKNKRKKTKKKHKRQKRQKGKRQKEEKGHQPWCRLGAKLRPPAALLSATSLYELIIVIKYCHLHQILSSSSSNIVIVVIKYCHHHHRHHRHQILSSSPSSDRYKCT